jgi:hypothetical protein
MEKYDARKLSTDAQQKIRYQVIRLKKKVTNDLQSVKLPESTLELFLNGALCIKLVGKKP